MAQYMLLLLFFERTTAGEAPTVSNLLNQKEPTLQKRQNKKQQQRRKQVAWGRLGQTMYTILSKKGREHACFHRSCELVGELHQWNLFSKQGRMVGLYLKWSCFFASKFAKHWWQKLPWKKGFENPSFASNSIWKKSIERFHWTPRCCQQAWLKGHVLYYKVVMQPLLKI